MKNIFRRVIILFLSITLCGVLNDVLAQSSNKPHKVKITKPGNSTDGIEGVRNTLKEIGKNDYELRLKEKYINDGIYYNVYEVYKDGIVVYDAGITVVSINGNIKQIFSYIPDSVNFENHSHDEQFNNKWLFEYEINKTSLVYFFNEDDNSYNLVWKVETVKDGMLYTKFVENKSGEILESNKVVRNYQDVTVTGNVNTLYNGNKTITLTKRDYSIGQDEYYLTYNGISSGGIVFESGYGWRDRINWINDENVWTETNDRIAASAFWVMQNAYTFFHNSLGYDTDDYGYFSTWKDTASYDGVAGYDSQNHRIIYGKAVSGVHNTAVSIDIIGHEYGHKIIHDKGGGIQNNYRDEMAAIEEGYADIFGRCLQENAESYNASRIEVLGEDIAIDPTFKRSFSNPNSLGFHYEGMSETPILGQPDTYEGDYFYRGTLDFGGAHINGGVINYWFYLLTHGGNGTNDFNDSYSVTGIGSNKAFKIVYHSLPLLMYETSFSDARNATIIAAENLYGLGSNESQQVLNAWEAVGVAGNCLSVGLDIPNHICTATSVTAYNYPTGATFLWFQSSNITRDSPQGINPCSFSSASAGEGWIKVIVSSSCGIDTIFKPVYSGTSLPGISPLHDPNCSYCQVSYGQVGTEYMIAAQTDNPSTYMYDYQWEIYGPGDEEGYADYGKQIYYTPPAAGTFTFKLKQNWTCGWSDFAQVERYVYGGYRLLFSPNPTTGETTLTIESVSEAKMVDEIVSWELDVYDNAQNLKLNNPKVKGKECKFDTSGWKEGVYIVRVKYKDEILTGKLIVKK